VVTVSVLVPVAQVVVVVVLGGGTSVVVVLGWNGGGITGVLVGVSLCWQPPLHEVTVTVEVVRVVVIYTEEWSERVIVTGHVVTVVYVVTVSVPGGTEEELSLEGGAEEEGHVLLEDGMKIEDEEDGTALEDDGAGEEEDGHTLLEDGTTEDDSGTLLEDGHTLLEDGMAEEVLLL